MMRDRADVSIRGPTSDSIMRAFTISDGGYFGLIEGMDLTH